MNYNILKYIPALAILCASSTFSATNYHSPGVKVDELLATSKTLTGQELSYPLKEEGSKLKVTMVKTTIAPGANTGWHKHILPEVIYVNKGTLTLSVEEDESIQNYTFHAGQSTIEAVDTVHRGQNLGKTPVELIAVFIGRDDLQNVIPTKKPVQSHSKN